MARNRLADLLGQKLLGMSLVHQVGGGTNGSWGRPVAVEHGELGVLQRYTTSPLAGGGRASGGQRSVEPNTTGLTSTAAMLLAGETLVRSTGGR